MANKRLSAVITIGGAVAASLRGAFGTVTSETNKLGTSIQRLAERQRQLNTELERIGRNGANTTGARMRAFYAQQEADAIGRQIKVLRERERIEKARAVNGAQRAELRGKIGATVATGAALSAPIGLAINRAANFQYELQLIGNTAEMNAGQVAQLGATVVQVSKDTHQSATNIRKGLGFLIAAGMQVPLATQYVGSIGKSATATNADVEDLSKMVFTLADSLKIAPSGMQAAIDSLAQAGKEGNVELRDMAGLLPVLGSGFVAMKMQGREAAATMGAALQIARKGSATAEQAGTNFENFLNKVMSPETRKKAAKMGLDIESVIRKAQAAGQNPFEAAVEAIAKTTKGGDQRLLGDLFQDMQVQSFLRPMIQNWEKYREIKAKALSADGVTDRDYQAMLRTTKQQMNDLANAAERLGIAVGSVFTADAGGKSTSMATRIGELADFVTAHKDLVAVTFKVVGGLFAARLAVLGVAYAWRMATGVWLASRAVWLAAPGVIAAVGAAATAASAQVMGLLALAGKAGLVGLAGAAGYGVGTLLYKGALEGNAGGDFVGRNVARVLALFGNKDAAEALRAESSANLPKVPPMASRGAGTTVQDNSQNTYQFTLPPNADVQQLADEIERRTRAAAGVRARSRMVDGVGAQ